jgi:hypothetical protein
VVKAASVCLPEFYLPKISAIEILLQAALP